jgi:Arc/MetJ-type ribon-helix-helix transcriptional regulator
MERVVLNWAGGLVRIAWRRLRKRDAGSELSVVGPIPATGCHSLRGWPREGVYFFFEQLCSETLYERSIASGLCGRISVSQALQQDRQYVSFQDCGGGREPAADPCYHDLTRGSISSMKVSVSLPEDDVDFLDSYAREQGMDSRSAALHKAVGLLRTAQLAGAYEDAWESWTSSADAEAWESVTADGLGA